MNFTEYFRRHPQAMPGLNGVEKIALAYIALTLLLTAIFCDAIEAPVLTEIIIGRLAIVGVTLLLWQLYRRRPSHATYQLRTFFQVALLAYWYPDIYNFASLMPAQDHLLAAADQAIFGYQPSIAFSRALSTPFWNELFNMGYFSYYLMIAAIVLLVTIKRPRRFDRVTFIVMATFFMFYTFFLFFNSAGPQFYFNCPGVDPSKAIFPAVDTYFRHHAELTHHAQPTGLFSYLIHQVQQSERPIAAFPSSHVGASTIILLLTLHLKRWWGLVMAPFWLILCLSTVYIGAHYAIDIAGGLVFALIFLWAANSLYETPLFHRPRGFNSLHLRRRRHQHSRNTYKKHP